MIELVKTIATALVDNPEQIEISIVEGNQSSVIELKVAKADLGKIIGKKGNNVKAIRSILNAASGKGRKRIVLELIE